MTKITRTTLSRRALLRAAGGASLAWLFGHPLAGYARGSEAYPSRTITMVLPFAPGNSSDTTARVLAKSLSARLQQQVIVENIPGGGGVSAIRRVAAAKPDGYTLLYIGTGVAITQALFTPPPYDVLKEFIPVATMSGNDVLLLASANATFRTLRDLTQEASSRGPAFMVGVSLLGTTQHLTAELFKSRLNLNYTIVPYRSAGAVLNAIVAGEINCGFEFIPPSQSLLKANKVHALAICGAKRSVLLPEVATMAELALPDFNMQSWSMMMVPSGTSDEIVKHVNQEIQHVLKDSEVATRLNEIGIRVIGGTAAEAREFLAAEITRCSEIVRTAQIKLR